MDAAKAKARCTNCRSEVDVPDSYTDGDHIKCGVCGTQHKVQRGEVLRLILADVEPVREALRENDRRISSLKDELQRARGSLGVGIETFAGVGVIYCVWRIVQGQTLNRGLVFESLLLGLVAGCLAELANFLFLAKRNIMSRLSSEIGQLQSEGRSLQQRIREASRR
jgi:hypothetical protein